MSVDELLEIIQRTNPKINKNLLIESGVLDSAFKFFVVFEQQNKKSKNKSGSC